jgi:hypothetical protein
MSNIAHSSSAYFPTPHVYKTKTTAKIWYFVVSILCIIGGVAAIDRLRSMSYYYDNPNAFWMLVVGILFILSGVLVVVHVLTYRLTIDSDGVEKSSFLLRRRIRHDEIVGKNEYTYRPIGTLGLIKYSGFALMRDGKYGMNLLSDQKVDPAFPAWLASLPDWNALQAEKKRRRPEV